MASTHFKVAKKRAMHQAVSAQPYSVATIRAGLVGLGYEKLDAAVLASKINPSEWSRLKSAINADPTLFEICRSDKKVAAGILSDPSYLSTSEFAQARSKYLLDIRLAKTDDCALVKSRRRHRARMAMRSAATLSLNATKIDVTKTEEATQSNELQKATHKASSTISAGGLGTKTALQLARTVHMAESTDKFISGQVDTSEISPKLQNAAGMISSQLTRKVASTTAQKARRRAASKALSRRQITHATTRTTTKSHDIGSLFRKGKAVASASVTKNFGTGLVGVSSTVISICATTLLVPVLLVGIFISILTATATATTQLSDGGSSVFVEAAKAEYQTGVASGSYHLSDNTYWDYVMGEGSFINGAATPWCAAFISYVAHKAGVDDVIPASAAAGYWTTYYQNNPDKGTSHYGDVTYSPQAGDIVSFNDSGMGSADHTGIVCEVTDNVDGSLTIMTVEGNTGYSLANDGSVRQHTYTLSASGSWSDKRSLSFVTPAFSGSSAGSITIPESDGTVQVGTVCTIENFPRYNSAWTLGPQGSVQNAWVAAGSVFDQYGNATLNGRYLIACTSTFGSIGDEVDFYLEDGTKIPCVICDEKSQKSTWYDQNPATKWGHDGGACVLEFCARSGSSNPMTSGNHPEWGGHRIASATNLGISII